MGLGLWTDRVYITLSLALPTFLDNNNNVFFSVFRGAGVYGVAKTIYIQISFQLLGLRCLYY